MQPIVYDITTEQDQDLATKLATLGFSIDSLTMIKLNILMITTLKRDYSSSYGSASPDSKYGESPSYRVSISSRQKSKSGSSRFQFL